ncbi:MAG: hypothetical protein MMC33_004627 [Icmadophila ericetorum]|nr:hypothetical protein [Icmadophila ericetorum]
MSEPAVKSDGFAATASLSDTTSSKPSESEKPAVLIVGGLGYIGRFLALYIHKNNLGGEVRLVDKQLPQLAWLAPEFAEACSQGKFMQADASKEQSLSRIFTLPSGREFDYVFNCGGETHYSQDDSVYSARSLSLTTVLATECARRKIPAYIEFSTGLVYKPPTSSTIASGGCKENASTDPWLKLAKYKLLAEEALEKIRREGETKEGPGKGLRYAVLRLAHVYGEYDVGYLARGLCLARVYQSKNEKMKWLYSKDLRQATIHVSDVCSAAWLAAKWCASLPSTPSLPLQDRIFNIVDKGSTSQQTLSTIIAAIFNIQTGFQNALINAFAKFNLENVVDDVNEDVLQPWADLISKKGIARPGPISPFMEKELLTDKDLCMSGERAEKVLGWRPQKEKMSEEDVRGVVASYERIGWWP